MFRSNEINHKDNWRRVSRRKEDFTSQNAPAVADYEYTYSKGLHLIGKQENTENRRTAYQYDSYYRLRRVDYDCDYSSSDPTCANNRDNVFKCNQSETDCEDFQLDGVHNIRSSYENQTNFAWTVDGFNRLMQKSWNNNTTTYVYDSNNNLISEDLDGDQNADIVYTYDKLNRLTSVANSDYLVEYSYDPFNRRTEKTVYYTENSDTYEQTHKYVYNDWDIISEEIKTLRTSDNPVTTTAWQLRRYVDQGTDNHIIMDTVSCSDDGNGNCSPNESTLQRIWFHKDERGNIIAISDGNGTIYERYRYRVYGEHEVLNADFTPKTTAAISPFLWGGSLYEPETNLYWMRNRYYHINMHRFINQDPIGIWGDANNLGNGFAYVAGMVIEASDPTGLEVIITVNRTEDDEGILLSEITVFSTNTGESISLYGLERNNGNAEAMPPYVYPYTLIRTDKPLGFRIQYTERLHQIHKGNYPWDSQGCILPGIERGFASREKRDDPRSDGKIHKGDTYSKSSIQSKDAMDLIKNIYKNDGSDTVLVIITDKDEKFADTPAEEAFNDENPTLKKEKDDNLDLSYTNKVRTVYPNGAVVDCEFGSCWCVSGNCAGAMNGNMPSNPDEDLDSVQQYLAFNILKKMLRLTDDSEEKPFEKYESDGYIMFVRNPFYRQKDPLKTIIKDGHNGRGFMFVRNPFAAPAEYNPFVSTADFWFNSDFNRGNIDPYWY